MQVVKFTQNDRSIWDAFVLQQSSSLPFHLFGWQEVMNRCYHYPLWYLAALEADQIEGVLPLMRISSKLIGDSIRSLPGGICSINTLAAEALLDYAKEIAACFKVDYLIIQDSRRPWEGNGLWSTSCSYSFRELPTNCTALYKGLKRQIQQHIHKSEISGVSVCSVSDCLDDFYRAYCDLMHEKGVPVFGRPFFEAVLEEFGDRIVMITARQYNQVVGAIFLFLLRDTVFALWGGAHSRHWEARASHALWWGVLKYAVENGYEFVDMGRSQCGSGTELFKSRWGCHTQPVYDMCLSLKKRPANHLALKGYDDLPYRVFTRTWQLLPDNLVELLGPKIRSHIPFG